MKKIKLYVLITVVSIVLLAWLLVVVIVFQKNHADIFFFDNNKEIEYQYGNYKAGCGWLCISVQKCRGAGEL